MTPITVAAIYLRIAVLIQQQQYTHSSTHTGVGTPAVLLIIVARILAEFLNGVGE